MSNLVIPPGNRFRVPLTNALIDGNGALLQDTLEKVSKIFTKNQISRLINHSFEELKDHTLLHAAVEHGYSNLCKILISYGADIRLDDYNLAKKKGGLIYAELEPRLLGGRMLFYL